MQVASKLISKAQRNSVREAVEEAESHTSAEIVPVIATASGRYDRAEDIVGVWLGTLLMLGVWWLYPDSSGGEWGVIPPWLEAVALVAAVVIGFLLGAIIAAKTGWLRRLFVPRGQMEEEVASRAAQVFFDSRVHHTEGASGILFYVSLFERRALVHADKAIEDKLGDGALKKYCDELISKLHSGEDPADALCSIIKQAGTRLREVLPRDDDDVNELEDALVILD